jgi:RNA polymerase subunit RPABC4/transcription elongation factor Spt4
VNDPDGIRNIYAWVNRDGTILESDYDNNMEFDPILVTYAPFGFTETEPLKDEYNTGEEMKVRYMVRFTDTGDPVAQEDYTITIFNSGNNQQYGDTVVGTTNVNGMIWVDVAAPADEGEYYVIIAVNYGGEMQSVRHDFGAAAEEEFPIPIWMILMVIGIAVAVVLLVGVFLAKAGLGKLVECGECGAFIPEGEKTCPKCGAVFESDTAKCSECGAWIPVDSKSCPDCGAIFTGLEKEKKDYIESMKLQYTEYVEQYRGEAQGEVGTDMSDEDFMEWWKASPKYVGFEEWLAREEELKKGRTKNCPECNTINPESTAICFKCGSVFKEEEEEEELPPASPPPEVPAKKVVAKQAAPTVVPKKVSKPPEVVPKKVVKTPPTVVPKKVVQRPPDGQPVVVPKKVVKRPPPEEE